MKLFTVLSVIFVLFFENATCQFNFFNYGRQSNPVRNEPRQSYGWQQYSPWGSPNFGYNNYQNPNPWQQQQYQNPYQSNQQPSWLYNNQYNNNNNNYRETTANPVYTTQRPQETTTSFLQTPTPPRIKPLEDRTQETSTRKPPAPIQQNQNRISYRKCKEYSNLLKKKWQVASLSFHSTVQNIVGTDCDAVTGLIVGGVKANAGEFPHMAAIGYRNLNGDYSFSCGGSLISELFVLTAAHCSVADRTKPSIVRLGDLNLSVRDQGLPEVDIPIESFISHEAYNKKTRENDIALIKMKQAATFSDDIRPACLQLTQDIGKEKAIATGWGYTEVAGSTSDVLQKVSLDIIDNLKCKNVYDDEVNYKIYDSQMCAGVLAGGKDTCGGDSGGPLQVTIENKCVFGIVGVTSYGSTFCGSRNAPGIYTRVSSYIDWIEEKVWGNEN